MLASNGGHISRFTDVLEWGHRLAETPVGVAEGNPRGLWEAKGWQEFVKNMDPVQREAAESGARDWLR